MIAATVRILLGYALACLACAVTQVLFVITPSDLYALDGAARWERIGFAGLIALSAATQAAVFAAPFAALAVLFAHLQGLRGWAFYVFAGLAIALAGFSAIYAGEAAGQFTIANSYAVAAFAFSGIIAGYVYWIVAGHRAGGRPSRESFDSPPRAVPEARARDHLILRELEADPETDLPKAAVSIREGSQQVH